MDTHRQSCACESVAACPGLTRRLACASATAVLAAVALPAFADSAAAMPNAFTANESLVTSRADLIDPEYSQADARVTWVDRKGQLWVAQIDRNTGLFRPANGRGVLVDSDAMSSADIKRVSNGPEWMSTADGEQIVYTKFAPGLPHKPANARLALAARDASGTWQHRLLGDLPRLAPMSSTDANDTKPRIVYVDPHGNQYWRYANEPASEELVPWVPASPHVATRLVRGARAVVFVAPVDGASQVFRYGLDDQSVEQLTYETLEGGLDGTAGLYMWRAPEFANDFVFMILAKAATELRIYRQIDKASPRWSVIYTARTADGAKLSSPEPFVHRGRSYVFMAAALTPDSLPSAIFLSSIDVAHPMMRGLTPETPPRARFDPEVFVTSEGPFIYYNRLDPANPLPCPCTEGIYRTDTGLGSP